MMVTCSRYAASGSSVGVNSKSRPTCAGAKRFFFTPIAVLPALPWTISMHTRRCLDADAPAAVFANTVRAGTMASRSGRATVAPIPLRTARRDTCFFEMYIGRPLFSSWRDGFPGAHLEGRTVDDSQDKRGEAVAVLRRLLRNRANRRLVVVLDA